MLTAARSQDDGPIGEAAGTLLQRLETAAHEPVAGLLPFATELRRRMIDLRKQAEARVAGKSAGELIELLSNPDAYTRGAAATALADAGRTDALPRLIDALSKEQDSNLNIGYMARLRGSGRREGHGGPPRARRRPGHDRTVAAARAMAVRSRARHRARGRG